jgi:hypothetical protein
LDLAYQFIACELKKKWGHQYLIPKLWFTRTMIAVIQEGLSAKAFLVKEWIDNDNGYGFLKYINNHHAESCLDDCAPLTAHGIVEFLCFAQHIQWFKSKYLTFTSDYQGASNLLTDPQIIADPCVL